MNKSIKGSLIGLFLGFIISGIFLFFFGFEIDAILGGFRGLFKGSFGSLAAFSNTLKISIPLIIGGIGILISFKSGMFNIGMDGQIYIGAIGATFVVVKLSFLPGIIGIIVALVVAMLFGAILGFIPGILKVKYDINEVVTTLLFNYLALYFLKILLAPGNNNREAGILQSGVPYENQSMMILDKFFLKDLNFGQIVIPSFFIVVLALVLMANYIINKTKSGYMIRATGISYEGAKYAGIKVKRVQLLSITFCGLLGGLIGYFEVLGNYHRLINNFALSVGFTSIAVALLGKLNPIGVLFSGLFIGGLTVGGVSMQLQSSMVMSIKYGKDLSIPPVYINFINGILIVCVLVGSQVNWSNITKRIRLISRRGKIQ